MAEIVKSVGTLLLLKCHKTTRNAQEVHLYEGEFADDHHWQLQAVAAT